MKIGPRCCYNLIFHFILLLHAIFYRLKRQFRFNRVRFFVSKLIFFLSSAESSSTMTATHSVSMDHIKSSSNQIYLKRNIELSMGVYIVEYWIHYMNMIYIRRCMWMEKQEIEMPFKIERWSQHVKYYY